MPLERLCCVGDGASDRKNGESFSKHSLSLLTARGRLSSITGKPVATLPSALVKDLFCTFATPKSGIAQASIGKPPKRAKVDRLAQDAVEDL